MGIVCTLLDLFLLALFVTMVLTWFPFEPGSTMASVRSTLLGFFEPILRPLRGILPPMGGIDISPIVLSLGVIILRGALC